MTPIKAWRVLNPQGCTVLVFSKTRASAILFVGDHVSPKIFSGLLKEHTRVAGWSKITFKGWVVEPIPLKGKSL